VLRAILLSAIITVTWDANSEAQTIPHPAHPCLESICGPVEIAQPYSYQIQNKIRPEPAADEYPRDVQDIASDIKSLGEEQRDLKNLASEKALRDEKQLLALQREHADEFEQLKATLEACHNNYIWYQRNLPTDYQIEHIRSETCHLAKLSLQNSSRII